MNHYIKKQLKIKNCVDPMLFVIAVLHCNFVSCVKNVKENYFIIDAP